MKTKLKYKLKVFAVSMLIVIAVSFLGSIFTSGETRGEWYESVRPSITPPNFVFPIVWSILFFLIGLSLYFSWISADREEKYQVAVVFAFNLILNVFWSFLYFGKHNAMLALIDLVVLWISIIAMIYVTGRVNKKSAWLLVPYLLWVSFAGVLNYLSI